MQSPAAADRVVVFHPVEIRNSPVEISNIARDSVEQLHRRYIELMAGHQEEANNKMEIEGFGIVVEADEIVFRCKADKEKRGSQG